VPANAVSNAGDVGSKPDTARAATTTTTTAAPAPAAHDVPEGHQLANRRWRWAKDPASKQLLVQAALNGHPELATLATVAIWRCLDMERRAATSSASSLQQLRELLGSEAAALDLLAFVDSELRLCQALDAASRAQWDTLMRRALETGPIGTAAELISEAFLSSYSKAAEAQGLALLQRDARACDERSMRLLYVMTSKADWLTANERAAYWQVLRSLYQAGTDELSRMKLGWLRAPPDPGQAAEVERLVDEISARC
jgi:hypothetical protein